MSELLCQDISRGLALWFAGRIDARHQVRTATKGKSMNTVKWLLVGGPRHGQVVEVQEDIHILSVIEKCRVPVAPCGTTVEDRRFDYQRQLWMPLWCKDLFLVGMHENRTSRQIELVDILLRDLEVTPYLRAGS